MEKIFEFLKYLDETDGYPDDPLIIFDLNCIGSIRYFDSDGDYHEFLSFDSLSDLDYKIEQFYLNYK